MRKTQKLHTTTGDIAYRDDIVSEVMKRTGYSVDQVCSVFDFMFPELKKFMARPDIYTVKCDNLGVFYFKSRYATHTAKALRNRLSRVRYKRKLEASVEAVKSKSEVIDAKFEEACENAGRRLQTQHYAKGLMHRKYFHNDKTLDFLERRQNKQEP
jgi:hypothetical protein